MILARLFRTPLLIKLSFFTRRSFLAGFYRAFPSRIGSESRCSGFAERCWNWLQLSDKRRDRPDLHSRE